MGSNESVPSTDNLIYLSDVLGVTVEEIISDNHEYKNNKLDKLGFTIGYSFSAVALVAFFIIS